MLRGTARLFLSRLRALLKGAPSGDRVELVPGSRVSPERIGPTVVCPRCKRASEIVAQYDAKRYYTECPGCSYKIRLLREPQMPRSRSHLHMSKKERIRRRWEGREAERFERDPDSGR